MRADHALIQDLLHLGQYRSTFAVVEFDRLLLEQRIDIGVVAVNIRPALYHKGFEARRGIAERSAAGLDDVLQLLVSVLLIERGPLQRTQSGMYPDGTQVIVRRLGEVRIRTVAIIVTSIEAIGVPGFGEKLLGLLRVVHGFGRLPEKFKVVGNQAAMNVRKAERQRLIDRLEIERETRSLPHAHIVPR